MEIDIDTDILALFGHCVLLFLTKAVKEMKRLSTNVQDLLQWPLSGKNLNY